LMCREPANPRVPATSYAPKTKPEPKRRAEPAARRLVTSERGDALFAFGELDLVAVGASTNAIMLVPPFTGPVDRRKLRAAVAERRDGGEDRDLCFLELALWIVALGPLPLFSEQAVSLSM
jgi:hypothetical protein